MLDPDHLLARDMQVSDLSEVLVIERAAQASPWGRISFEESLARQHICRVLVDLNAPERTQSLCAFHVVCPVADELHILNLVVAKPYQGQGMGHRLMHDILECANSVSEVKKIFLEVRASNEAAQNLYRQWQFQQIAVRKNYYRAPDQTREDALIYVKQLNP